MEREFNDRISAQRMLLRVINGKPWPAEDLSALSSKAIERWILANRIDPTALIVRLISQVSERLFFLANKSQDQVSEQYRAVRGEIAADCEKIRCALERNAAQPVRP